MTIKSAVCATLLTASAFAATVYAPPAVAGDVSGAQMACYVDTYAYDQQETDYCASVWTPGRADNPTTAVFTVVGLPAGSYSYRWRNVENGAWLSCTSSSCTTSIATETRGDGQAILEATVTDTATGASRTVSAVAEYYDGWN